VVLFLLYCFRRYKLAQGQKHEYEQSHAENKRNPGSSIE
jgi:hypothetical protein